MAKAVSDSLGICPSFFRNMYKLKGELKSFSLHICSCMLRKSVCQENLYAARHTGCTYRYNLYAQRRTIGVPPDCQNLGISGLLWLEYMSIDLFKLFYLIVINEIFQMQTKLLKLGHVLKNIFFIKLNNNNNVIIIKLN